MADLTITPDTLVLAVVEERSSILVAGQAQRKFRIIAKQQTAAGLELLDVTDTPAIAAELLAPILAGLCFQMGQTARKAIAVQQPPPPPLKAV